MSGERIFEAGALPYTDATKDSNKAKIKEMFDAAKIKVDGFAAKSEIDSLTNMKDAPMIVEMGDKDKICRPLMKEWHDLWCAAV